MAFSPFTDGATDLTEGLVAEAILPELIYESRAPAIAMMISTVHDFSPQGASLAQRIIRIKNVASRTQTNEGDDLTGDDVDLDEESITPTTHYIYRVLGYQVSKDFIVAALPEVVKQGARAILEAVDANGLSKFQNAIASVGGSTTTMDLDTWATALYTWGTLDAGGMPIFVGHNIHLRDFKASIRSSGATIEATGRAAQLFEGINGFLGTYEGVAIFESTNVSETGSAKQGALLSMGSLRYGVWNGIEARVQDAVANLATQSVVWHRCGFALETNGEASTGADSRIVKVLCKNT